MTEETLVVGGHTLKRAGLGKAGWICSDHGRVSLTLLWKQGREYPVCWYCASKTFEITEAIYDKRRTRSEADELADRERRLPRMD